MKKLGSFSRVPTKEQVSTEVLANDFCFPHLNYLLIMEDVAEQANTQSIFLANLPHLQGRVIAFLDSCSFFGKGKYNSVVWEISCI